MAILHLPLQNSNADECVSIPFTKQSNVSCSRFITDQGIEMNVRKAYALHELWYFYGLLLHDSCNSFIMESTRFSMSWNN